MKYEIDRNDERERPQDRPYWFYSTMDNRKIARVPGPGGVVLYLEDVMNTEGEMENLCRRLHSSMQDRMQTEPAPVPTKELRLPLVGGGTLLVNPNEITYLSAFNGSGETTAMISMGGTTYNVVATLPTIFGMLGK